MVGLLLLVVRRLVGTALVDALTSDATREHGLGGLADRHGADARRLLALIVYGLVLLLGVLLAGPTRWATWMREKLAPVMRDRPCSSTARSP